MSFKPSRLEKQTQKTNEIEESDFWDGVIDVPQNEWIFDIDEFEKETPSRLKNISFQDEINKRVKGIVFIFNCCKQLRLSRSVGLTASTIFHRFYMFEDLQRFHYFEVATTSLFVACKSDECRRNLKDVVKICAKISTGKPTPIDEDSKIYWKWKDLIVKLEELMLRHLNFDVSPLNPYKITSVALKLDLESPPPTAGTITNKKDTETRNLFGNCTFLFEIFSRLPICLFYSPDTICALVVILSTKKFNITFPTGFIYEEFNISVDEVIRCYDTIVSLATDVEVIDKYFRILQNIPRFSPEDIQNVFVGSPENTLQEENYD